jgi:hypothetical protein
MKKANRFSGVIGLSVPVEVYCKLYLLSLLPEAKAMVELLQGSIITS